MKTFLCRLLMVVLLWMLEVMLCSPLCSQDSFDNMCNKIKWMNLLLTNPSTGSFISLQFLFRNLIECCQISMLTKTVKLINSFHSTSDSKDITFSIIEIWSRSHSINSRSLCYRHQQFINILKRYLEITVFIAVWCPCSVNFYFNIIILLNLNHGDSQRDPLCHHISWFLFSVFHFRLACLFDQKPFPTLV